MKRGVLFAIMLYYSWSNNKMNIGSRVKFVNKVSKTETDVPLGSIGILY